jgi:hypothetical protein
MMKKPWESQRGKRAQETQMLGECPNHKKKWYPKQSEYAPDKTTKKGKSKKSDQRKDERHKELNCW